MEDLKQYRVDFRVTYHCIGRKGFFHKREYAFDFIIENDSSRQTYSYINSRSASRALKKAKIIATKHAAYTTKQAKGLTGDKFLILTGNTAPDGEFKWSPKVYDITGFEVELVKITQVRAWREEKVSEAMKELSIKEFKGVFGETIPQQAEE